MNRHLRTLVLGALGCAAIAAVPGDAFAAGGTVSGTLQHFNRMGNFCPTSRDCTGAKYPQSQFNTYRPIRHVKVYVRDPAGTVLGQGTTNGSGGFSVSWFSPTLPATIHVTWHAEQKDNRFTLYNADGATWYFWTYGVPPVDGGTTALGTLAWGASGAPHDITNWYDGAHRTWWDSLFWSSRQTALFNNVSVYLGSTRCATSCANGDENKAWLDPNSAYAPHERIMHELGHIASDRGHEGGNYWQMVDYCWPGTGGGCSWNQTSPEWNQSAMEEATASTYASMGLYASNAVAPHDCLVSQAACATGAFNLETSSGTTCAVDENRFQLTMARTFWDLYDAHADTASGFTDSASTSIDNMVQAFTRFPNGRSDRQKNEGWGCFIIEELATCWPDNRDARNMDDYRQHYFEQTGVSGNTQLRMNCL